MLDILLLNFMQYSWWIVFYWILHFFLQGNSNSLASIDIASGYVGQIGYNPIVVGILLITNTYSAPVLSYLLLITKLIFQSQEEGTDRYIYSSLIIV